MNFTAFKTGFMNSLNKTSFKLKKSSPEILIITAAVGAVAGVVTACIATTKVPEVLEEHKESMEKIHEAEENPEIKPTEQEVKKAMTKVYARTVMKFVRLYALPTVIEATSILCMISSHNMLRKRNLALGAAYTAVDTAFKNYRKNVVERFGEEVDNELRFGLEKKETKETVVDEDGKKKTVTKEHYEMKAPMGYSEYARCFDELNPLWQADNEVNKRILINIQNTMNDLLRARGYVFLNEVYIALGFEPTKAGQIVGWVKHGNDQMIDFGMHTVHKDDAKKFVNGYENAVILDFNVDGPILDNFEHELALCKF